MLLSPGCGTVDQSFSLVAGVVEVGLFSLRLLRTWRRFIAVSRGGCPGLPRGAWLVLNGYLVTVEPWQNLCLHYWPIII